MDSFRWMNYLYIIMSIVFTVYGQLILKWRLANFGALPIQMLDKIKFFFTVITDPFVFSSFIAAFLTFLAWIITLTKFDLNYAYSFLSLNFVIVLLFSGWLLQEPINIQKIIGCLFIILGIVIASYG